MAVGEQVQINALIITSIFHMFARQAMFLRHVFDAERRVAHIREDCHSKLSRSRDRFAAERHKRLRRYRRLKAAALQVCLQQQVERKLWKREWTYGQAFWSSVLNKFDDEQWREHFRMSRSTFESVLQLLEPALSKQTTNWRKPLEARQRLAIVLWWLATPSEYRNVACLFGVGISTVCVLVRQVTAAIKRSLLKRFICLPTGDGLQSSLRGFTERGYPMCAGAVDATHIPVITPKARPHSYCNQRGWHSVLLQAVVDHNCCFTDIYVGSPGGTPDARVLTSSPLYKKAENLDGYLFPRENARAVNGVEIPVHLIGGAAYPLKPWVMKEFSQHERLTPEQCSFNRRLGSARTVVQNAFARLKGRWRCLLKRNNVDIALVPDIVTACCILHNVCELNKEDFLPEWSAELAEDLQEPDTEAFHGDEALGPQAVREAVMSIL